MTPNVDELQLSDLIRNYAKELKSIKRLRIDNTELLDGVDHVSRNFARCIELAKSAL